MSSPSSTTSRPLRWLNLYLILILLGLSGMLFAQQLPNPVLRAAVVLLSLSAPLFAGGHLLARFETGGYARYVLAIGVIMLVAGAVATMAQFPEMIDVGEPAAVENAEETPQPVLDFSRWLGLLSLILGVVAILMIVARREWQIEELGHRFRSLAEHMGEGFILADANRTVTLVNKSLLKMTGLSESDLIGRHFDALIEDLNLKPEIIRQGDDGAIEVHVAASMPAGERYFWVSSVPIADTKDGERGSIATVRDMTEHRRMAEQIESYAEELEEQVEERTKQLARSEQRLRDLLLQMSEGVVTVDDEFVIRFVNNRFCDMVQVSAEELRGRSLLDFLPGVERAALDGKFNAAREGAGSRVELNVRREDGSEIPALLARAPFHDDRTDEPQYSIVLTDVGELKLMQRQLQEHALELEEANRELMKLDRAKDGFLTNVSHELRTPLSTIRGYLEMLKSGNLGEVPEDQSGAIDVMMRNTERLNTLIAEMISFSRMQIQGVELHTTLFGLNNLLEEAIASAQPEAIRQGIELRLQTERADRIAWGDSDRIGQILTIFLSNAIKFSNQGDTVELRAECSENGDVRLAVRDEGIGIPQAQQPRVFDKFYQVDGALNRRFEGAGIGLSIAKSLADAHGGRIDLESEVGEGSTFTLVLPNAAFDPQYSAPDFRFEDAPVLLVVEDDGIRNAAAELLRTNGASVVAAATSFEGIRKTHERQPSVVIASARLKDVDGAALIHDMAKDVPRDSMKGAVLVEGSGAGFEPGGGVVGVARPFSPKELVQCVALQNESIRMQQSNADSQPWKALVEKASAVLMCGPRTQTIGWVSAALQDLGVQSKFAENPAHIQIAMTRPGIVAAIVDRQTGDRESAAALEFLEQHSPDELTLFALDSGDAAAASEQGAARHMRGIVSLAQLLGEIAQRESSGDWAEMGVESRV